MSSDRQRLILFALLGLLLVVAWFRVKPYLGGFTSGFRTPPGWTPSARCARKRFGATSRTSTWRSSRSPCAITSRRATSFAMVRRRLPRHHRHHRRHHHDASPPGHHHHHHHRPSHNHHR